MSDHLSSSDDDLEEMVVALAVPKVENFFEEIVPQFNEKQYLEHFRVSREITQQLAEQFEHSEYYNYQEGDSEKISPLKFVTAFLWFSSNEAVSYRVVADRFNISKSSLHKIIRRVSYFLSNLFPQVIKWPGDIEQVGIMNYFQEKGFPGIIGVIDGTHIRIDKPADDPDSYLNRKHFYSIQVKLFYKLDIVNLYIYT